MPSGEKLCKSRGRQASTGVSPALHEWISVWGAGLPQKIENGKLTMIGLPQSQQALWERGGTGRKAEEMFDGREGVGVPGASERLRVPTKRALWEEGGTAKRTSPPLMGTEVEHVSTRGAKAAQAAGVPTKLCFVGERRSKGAGGGRADRRGEAERTLRR